MRSGLTLCLVTVGVVLTASGRAEALTLTAADFSCYQSGPCPVAGSSQQPMSQLWDWYQAVAARNGGFDSKDSKDKDSKGSKGSKGSKDGYVDGSIDGYLDGSVDGYVDGSVNPRSDRVDARGGPLTEVGIIYIMGPTFQCVTCFLEIKNGYVATPSQSFFSRVDHSYGDDMMKFPHPPSAPTPEPGTMGLIMVGLALLAGPVRRLLRAERR
jgi:hypothetical protein